MSDKQKLNPKPKLGPADFMLLYIRINKVQDVYVEKKDEMWRTFDFEHVKNRWKPSDHSWSPDKNSHTHCYKDLEVDKYYLVLAWRVSDIVDTIGGRKYYRWIWRGALELSEKDIRKAYDFYVTNHANTRGCVEYAESLKYPTLTPAVDEFEYD